MKALRVAVIVLLLPIAIAAQGYVPERVYDSDDGRFTVIEVECLGACGFATPVMVNSDFIESVTPEKVPDLISKLT